MAGAGGIGGGQLLQDIERKSGDGDDEVSLKDGVSKDRMMSAHDPEMRHGHKSSRRFDGHNAASHNARSGLLWSRKMAKERLTSFVPGDVLRVVLRCTNCEGEIAYSMKRSIPNVPEECPLCPQDWSQSVRYEDYKARVELLCRALELLSVTDDGVFYDSAGDDESDWGTLDRAAGGRGSPCQLGARTCKRPLRR